MKSFLCSCLLLLCGSAFAASTNWSVYGILPQFDGGIAYIVEAEVDWTQAGIVEYIAQNGLSYAGESVAYDSAEITQVSGSYLVFNKTWTSAPDDLIGDYYVIVVDSESNEFAVSTPYHMSAEVGNLDIIYVDGTGAPIEENWALGVIGGDTPVDPDVPEPTALALLALGVAGVALRRRIR